MIFFALEWRWINGYTDQVHDAHMYYYVRFWIWYWSWTSTFRSVGRNITSENQEFCMCCNIGCKVTKYHKSIYERVTRYYLIFTFYLGTWWLSSIWRIFLYWFQHMEYNQLSHSMHQSLRQIVLLLTLSYQRPEESL